MPWTNLLTYAPQNLKFKESEIPKHLLPPPSLVTVASSPHHGSKPDVAARARALGTPLPTPRQPRVPRSRCSRPAPASASDRGPFRVSRTHHGCGRLAGRMPTPSLRLVRASSLAPPRSAPLPTYSCTASSARTTCPYVLHACASVVYALVAACKLGVRNE